MEKKVALVVGGTGLTGSLLVQRLASSPAFRRVRLLARRTPAFLDPTVEVWLVDFDHLDVASFADATDVYSCLGTTLAAAGSREAFERVDYTWALRVAQLGAEAGASTLVLLSSVGSSPSSPFFYSRVKGKLEEDVLGLGYRSVYLFQPSLLLGERRERRPGEDIAQRIAPLVAPLFGGPLRKYRPIQADVVAAGMVGASLEGLPGRNTATYDRIVGLSENVSGSTTV